MEPIILKGRVEKNDEYSSTIGCSVSKIAIEQGVIIPALGVYFSETYVGPEKYNSIAWINDGRDKEILRLEIHLLDFENQLAGKNVAVTLLKKIRDIISFPGEEKMSKTIQEDLVKAKEWFAKGKA